MPDSQRGKLPPHSPEAEAALVGCMILDPVNATAEAQTLGVGVEWFYELVNQKVFGTIVSMVDSMKKVDLVTLSQALKDLGILEGIGGVSHLIEMTNATPSAANLPYYAEILKEKLLSRRIISACTRIAQQAEDGSEPINDILVKAEAAVLSVRILGGRPELPTMKDLATDVISRIEDRWKGNRGLSTGFLDIDKFTSGGMQDGEYWVVAARPNTGKTALVMNIVDRVASRWLAEWEATAKPGQAYDGKSVGVFSIEMTDTAIAERLVATRAKMDTRKELTSADLTKLGAAVPGVAKLPIRIDDSPLTIGQLRSRARRYYSRYNVRLFVLDYLQLVTSEQHRDSRVVQVDAISRGIKSIAKELKVPVLVVAQLNRDLEKDGPKRKPRMSDLRESGGIEQDADVVLFLYPDPKTPDNISPETLRTIFCRVGKQRNGGRDIDIPLTFFPDQVRFENGEIIR